MVNLLRAEWKKTIWNYVLTGFLVWGYPVGVAGFFAVMLIGGVFSRDWLAVMLGTGNPLWTENALGGWGILLAFPFTILTRLLPLSFMAAVFAGEYQSGMWKYLVPRTRRSFLILSKTAVLIGLMAIAFIVTSALIVAGQAVGRAWVGFDYGPALTGEVVSNFLVRYGQTVLVGVLALIILAAIAALAAILTRSVLGSLLVVFLFSTLDSLSMYILLLMSRIFSAPGLAQLYRFTPQCSLDNAQSWFATNAPLRLPFESYPTGPDLGFSLVMLVIWAAGLTALAAAAFERQDITA